MGNSKFLPTKLAFSTSILLKNVDLMTDFSEKQKQQNYLSEGVQPSQWFFEYSLIYTVPHLLHNNCLFCSTPSLQALKISVSQMASSAEPKQVLNHQTCSRQVLGRCRKTQEDRTVNLCDLFYFLFKIMNQYLLASADSLKCKSA